MVIGDKLLSDPCIFLFSLLFHVVHVHEHHAGDKLLSDTCIVLVFCLNESPRFPFALLLEFWEKAPKTVLYDNACHLHEYVANREPGIFKNLQFLIDKVKFKVRKAYGVQTECIGYG